jgi:hypothetical protein
VKRLTKRQLATLSVILLAGCWQSHSSELEGREAKLPSDFRFVGRSSPCYLELPAVPRSIRVNCFHIDGTLHIHSNRFANFPRWRGESWVKSVRRNPSVRIEIGGKIYPMSATPIDDDEQRQDLLIHERGYWHAWDGITVFSFAPR